MLFGQKKGLFMLLVLILGHFWCSVVTSVTFTKNFSKFKNNSFFLKKNKKIQKQQKLKDKKKYSRNKSKKHYKNNSKISL